MKASSDSTLGGFREDAFEVLERQEPGNFWFESRNRLIIWALRRYFPGASSFLEVGCGTGFVLQGLHAAYPSLELTALDAAGEGLAIARRRVPSATFIQQDLKDFVPARSFDVVGAFDVLEHVPDDEGVIARLYRAVRPGGGVIITVPQHEWLWSRADEVGHHVRRYRRADLLARVRSAGFEPVSTTSFVSVLLPAMAISRWRNVGWKDPADNNELKISTLANRVLSVAMAAERATIRAGVRWPAGGSLLTVARRPRTT